MPTHHRNLPRNPPRHLDQKQRCEPHPVVLSSNDHYFSAGRHGRDHMHSTTTVARMFYALCAIDNRNISLWSMGWIPDG